MQVAGEKEIQPADAGATMDPACAEVLAICRAVLEIPLELDDGFAEAGAIRSLIARLAQRLKASGWAVPVRALLSECNTARKVAAPPASAPRRRRRLPSHP